MSTDPSQNFIARPFEPLDAIFHPKRVALIGAKDDIGSVGRTLMANLLNEDFKGKIFPINPKRSDVYGLKAYPKISEIPEPVDLAVIVTPAKTVPSIIKECVDVGVKAAIVISAGFKEVGSEGIALEQEIVKIARSGNMPVIGPNCLGVMNPIIGFNATFAKGIALPGNIGFISQSGAMCTAVLDWSFRERIGFSSFVSIGSMADVNWGDLIHYLGDDPYTQSILIYMETVGDSRSFMTAAREIALEKPIIIIKGGRSPDAAKAAASHTGSLAGSDEVFEAALARAGVLRVNSISELFDMAALLGRQPLPKGPRLAIVTNAGGPSVIATDAAILNGAKLANLSKSSIHALNTSMPSAWSHGNPVDILGDASAERYNTAIEIISKDPNVDGLLVILSPQDMTDPTTTAQCIKKSAFTECSFTQNKPLLASWMGGVFVEEGITILREANIPTFQFPDNAAWAFAKMWQYSEHLQNLYETPTLNSDDKNKNPILAKKIIDKARAEGRILLDEFESKNILAAYSIPIVETLIAISCEEAVVCAKKLNFPVVIKLFSKVITHKTDVGGVVLNIKNEEEVREAFNAIQTSVTEKVGREAFEGVTVQKMVKLDGYELILGSSCDEQFGPVLLFGTGGQLVEIYKDRALGLPPLNSNLALRMMEKTKIFEALKGVRGRETVNLNKLTKILVNFSQLIVENPWIKELDINPLLASPQGIIALDARVVLHELDTPENALPLPAIRPYPSQYKKHFSLKNGISITLRPIKAEDEPLISEFHRELSENSVRQRYFEFISLDKRTAHERLVRICFNDYDKEIALVAVRNDDNGKESIEGIARLSKISNNGDAKMTMTIADLYHGKGLGTAFLEQLKEIAKNEKISLITADILAENKVMIHLCQKMGFKINFSKNNKMAHAKLILSN